MTPIEQWYGKKPYVGHPHVFGCVLQAHISDDYRRKLDENIHACIMNGHFEDSKYYRLFGPI
jgi:hypothetical protein